MAVADRPVAAPSAPVATTRMGAPQWVAVAGTLSFVAATAALRFAAINSQSLWYDEGVSAGMVGQGPMAIIREAAADFHPPLYYLALAGWARLFGDSVVALRGLSAVAGVVMALFTWRIGSRLFGSAAGRLTALWVAVAPLGVMFSQELRMYMPVAASVSAAAWCAVGWFAATEAGDGQSEASGRSAALLGGYVVAAAVALYLQYVAALGLVAIGIYGILRARGRTLVAWLVANALAIALFAPWLPVFHHQLAVGHTGVTAHTGVADVLTASIGSLLVGTDGVPVANRTAVALLSLFFGVGVGRAMRGGRRALAPVLLVAAPLAGVAAYAAWKSVYEVRYVLVALPGVAILGGLGLEGIATAAGQALAAARRLTARRREARGATELARRKRVGGHPGSRPFRLAAMGAAVLVLVAAAGGADLRYYLAPLHPHDDYRGLAATIARNSQAGDAILLYPPGQNYVFDYYYRGPDTVTSLPMQRPPNAAEVTAALATLFQDHPRVWVVEYGAAEADPNGVITNWLSRNAFLASHAWFGSPQLLLYAAGPAKSGEAPLGARFDNGATLRSYAVAERALQPGGSVAITLTWVDDRPISKRFTVFTHVLDASNHVVAQHDGEPAAGTQPTTDWRPGAVVVDRHAIVLPERLAPGTYTLEIGMYLPSSGVRATVVGANADRVLLGTITVGAGHSE